MLRARNASVPVGANSMQTFVNYRALDQKDRLNIKLFAGQPVLLNKAVVNPTLCCNPPPPQPAELQLCSDVSITFCQGTYCHMHQY